MKVDFDNTEKSILDVFSSTILNLESTLDGTSLLTVARDLSSGAWLEIALRSNADASFTLLAGCAQMAGSRQEQLSHPLLESWIAIRILEALGNPAGLLDSATSGESVITVATDLLSGNATGETSGYLAWGASADHTILPIPQNGGLTDVYLVAHDAVRRHAPNVIDPSMGASYLQLRDLRPEWIIGSLDRVLVDTLGAEFLVLQTAEMIGTANWLFARTMEYLSVRRQFGKTISSFQAVQHRAADLHVRLKAAESLMLYAAWSVGQRGNDHVDHARLAKGFGGETCLEVGAESLQLHGGVGYTSEGGLHHGIRRIMHRTVTGLSARESLVRVGARALDEQRVLGSFVPLPLRAGEFS